MQVSNFQFLQRSFITKLQVIYPYQSISYLTITITLLIIRLL